MQITGSCLCGKVQFDISDNFDSFYLCHCSRCRKATGTAHGANLFATKATLNWLKGQELVKTFNLPNTRFTKSFCTECGSSVPTEIKGKLVIVPAGCLDSSPTINPTAHIFFDDRASWEDKLSDTKRFAALPK
ncbi:aldehyde-activating protein [Kangiella profundi]|uniref:Aldehyde-activating protein n=1 Tax=Kangiella profundi TaxID=1561924 RepID=A0A2K9ASN6_9GAMM|nr:GFA family protein [Kangiella profundi]AUD78181.1 aldehyde-activating protein [Kangiella profundi]